MVSILLRSAFLYQQCLAQCDSSYFMIFTLVIISTERERESAEMVEKIFA